MKSRKGEGGRGDKSDSFLCVMIGSEQNVVPVPVEVGQSVELVRPQIPNDPNDE